MKVMMMIKLFVTAIAVTVALTIAISTTKNLDVVVEGQTGDTAATAAVVAPSSKRVSRFLAEEKNPRAADHCKRDNEICYVLEGKNSTCCNNKCMDLAYDKHNCGACKNKCKFTSTCCRGECVNLSFDKRHCGGCGNRCMTGGYCFYGMCDYA